MKNLIWLIITISLVFHLKLKAQTIDHPTIEKLEVSYKQVEGTGVIDAESIMYFPQLSIQLKNEISTSKLYLKMINEVDNSVLIDVNYSLSSLPVIDQNGKKIFYKDSDGYHIVFSFEVPLNLYLFQLITEDPQGNQSEIFSEIH